MEYDFDTCLKRMMGSIFKAKALIRAYNTTTDKEIEDCVEALNELQKVEDYARFMASTGKALQFGIEHGVVVKIT